MQAKTLVSKLKGVQCGMKGTSCSDQLATAVQEAVAKADAGATEAAAA
jgi:hypothetical protein